LPDGVVYEGVEAYGGKPQRFRGETGAETGIVPALDAALGIGHRDDDLRRFLTDLRAYLPPLHRAFVEAVEAGPSIREYVRSRAKAEPRLRDAYNACVAGVHRFRSRHLEYAGRYIQLQAQRSAANPTEVGTGGTPFLPYLRKHRDETAEHEVA
jgi:indoleamine 2,3-dioxygenase